MIELTQDLVKELFDYRDGELYWKVARQKINVGDLAGYVRNDGYRLIGISGKMYYAHRLIFLYHNGYLPKFLDHIDMNTSNNDISNLREATSAQNHLNRTKQKCYNCKPTSSIYKGVSRDKRREKWRSYITIDGKQKRLGSFTSEIEAAKAYNISAIKRFGEFACLNIIPKRL